MRPFPPSFSTPAIEAYAPRMRLHVTPATFRQLVRGIDTGLVAVSLAGAGIINGLHHLPLLTGGAWFLGAAAVVLLWHALTPSGAGSLAHRSVTGKAHARNGLRLWLIILPLLLGPIYAALGPTATANAATGLLPAAAISILWRAFISSRSQSLIKQGFISQRVVVAGGGREAEDTLVRLSQLRREGVHVLGLFDDRETARSPHVQHGVAKLGRIVDIPALLQRTPFDLIIVTLPPSAEKRISQVLSILWEIPVDIRLAPVHTGLVFRPRTYSWLGDVALLDLFDRPLRARDALLKRSFDLIGAAVLLVLLAPIMALIALALRLDSPGPVFFRQAREGYAARPFRVWKFRSLHVDKADHGAVVPVTAGDSRVTRVGAWLRKTSLDELPQLFNVLEGDMSLVGPRPHVVGARSREMEFANVVRSYSARHRVKPGMTGWAQVNGLRGPVQRPDEIRRRVALDLEYIDRWSIGFDLRILALTLPTVLRGENAV